MKPWERQYQSLCEAINHCVGSQTKKDWIKKDIKKTLRRVGFLDYRFFPNDFRWNLCAARLKMGDFSNWDGWEWRSDFSMTFNSLYGLKKMGIPYWDGKPVRHLVIIGEQGIGDEIVYGSCIPEVMVRLGHDPIEFQCHPRLQQTFSRSFNIKCTDRRVLSEITDGDAVVMLGDLMRFYRKDLSHFPKKPFLKPDPDRVGYWKDVLKKLGPKPKIGLGWRSRHGAIDPQALMSEDAVYIDLQYGSEGLEKSVKLGDPLKDLDDHLALVKALDKVVSVTQTLVHEAGAVGTRCDAIKPKKGTGEVNDTLWYYGIEGPHHVYGGVEVFSSIESYAKRHHRRAH
jgi:hypothetical protein